MIELATEIGRLRPSWLRGAPTNSAARHDRFWSSTVWEASKRDLFDRQSSAVRDEETAIEHVNAVTASNRDAWRSAGFNADTHGLVDRIRAAKIEIVRTDFAAELGPAASELTGPVEYWRAETALMLAGLFTFPDTEPFVTQRQWLDPYVDLALLEERKDDFLAVLLREAEPSRLIRQWLRWAIRFAQTAAKVTHGNPRDEQLTGYLPDVDLFLTNDRTFARLLQAVCEAAPAPLAQVRFVDLGRAPSVTDAIVESVEGFSV